MICVTRTACVLSLLSLAACGGSGDDAFSSPADLALGDLVYNGANSNVSTAFSGLPKTPELNVQTSGSASYTGLWQANLNGTYQTGDAGIQANFGTGTAVFTGRADFTGQSDTVGVVAFENTTAIDGNSFESTVPTGALTSLVSGHFYGDNAQYAAGFAAVTVNSSDTVSGAFITQRD